MTLKEFKMKTLGAADSNMVFKGIAKEREYSESEFLELFFPEQFLTAFHKVFKNGKDGKNPRRNKIFNGLSSEKKLPQDIECYLKESKNCEIWINILAKCRRAISEGCTSKEDINNLESILKDIIKQDKHSDNLDIYIQDVCTSHLEVVLAFTILLLLSGALGINIDNFEDMILHSLDDTHQEEHYFVNYINFGRYPQSVVSKELRHILEKIEPDNHNVFHYKGEQYIKYKAKIHKDSKEDQFKASFIFSNGEKIRNGTEYFFKVEPIRWRILNDTGENFLLLADKILDHGLFNSHINYTSFYHSNGALANVWEGSELKDWLNDSISGFLHMAFTKDEQEQISMSTIKNSVQWQSEVDSTQKIFLLSSDEVKFFRFNVFELKEQEERQKRAQTYYNEVCLDAIAYITDYAIARGVCPCELQSYLRTFNYTNITSENVKDILTEQGRWESCGKVGTWWLRSPGNKAAKFDLDSDVLFTRKVCDIMEDGHLCTRGSNVDGGLSFSTVINEMCDGLRNGIRPALFLKEKRTYDL